MCPEVRPFPDPLAKDSRLLLGFLMSAPTSIFGLLPSLISSQGYMKQKENLVNLPPWHYICPEVPSLLAFLSLPFSVLSFFTYCIRGFLFYLAGGGGRVKLCLLIFLRLKFLLSDLEKKTRSKHLSGELSNKNSSFELHQAGRVDSIRINNL